MLALLSPAKTLDFSPSIIADSTQPQFLKEADALLKALKKLSLKQIGALMDISPKLAALNYERFQHFDADQPKQAILAYKGDVYEGLQADDFTLADLKFAQSAVGILSGLYGLLHPLDLIHPYRLEMSIPVRTGKANDLYQFWGHKITDAINEVEQTLVINLASQEYFKAIHPKLLKAELLQVSFKEKKGKDYRMVALFAKKARGMMARYIILERIKTKAALKDFSGSGYRFHSTLSTPDHFVFTR